MKGEATDKKRFYFQNPNWVWRVKGQQEQKKQTHVCLFFLHKSYYLTKFQVIFLPLSSKVEIIDQYHHEETELTYRCLYWWKNKYGIGSKK